MKNATLRQLKVFESVARHLSFTRAARELYLTQPAVSTQVKQLEGHAGMPLFEQLGKKVYLTRAGTEMLHHSRAIIQQFREADEAMQQLKGVSGGKLNVTVISAGDYFFPHLLAGFARRHSGVVLNLSVVNRAELLRQMADNVTDLGVMVRAPQDRDVVAESFAPHPYVIVATPNHPLAHRRRIPLSTLMQAPFVVREEGSDTRHAMAKGFGARLSKLNIAMEIGSNETIKQAVMAGMGISFLSAHAVALELRVGSLVILDVQGFPLMQNWYVVHRREKRLPPVAAAFKQFLVDEGAALIEEITHFGARPGTRARPAAAGRKRLLHSDLRTG
jgi:LysR family transcriptional regulator, low CO2-responsive transcriptional regulator